MAIEPSPTSWDSARRNGARRASVALLARRWLMSSATIGRRSTLRSLLCSAPIEGWRGRRDDDGRRVGGSVSRGRRRSRAGSLAVWCLRSQRAQRRSLSCSSAALQNLVHAFHFASSHPRAYAAGICSTNCRLLSDYIFVNGPAPARRRAHGDPHRAIRIMSELLEDIVIDAFSRIGSAETIRSLIQFEGPARGRGAWRHGARS